LDERPPVAAGYHARAMQRVLAELGNGEFDLLVIGGGAAGAAVAREAALRGFRSALIERADFGSGTSAHCFKVVHGGIRYLQHADIGRMRASCRERAILLRIAPHLVAPLPFVVPTFGWGRSSRWLLGTGMRVYDALTGDLNRLIPDPGRRISATRFLSRSEVRELFPGVEARNLTGAAVFEDGQMYNPPRLVLALAAAAADLGAQVANYVEAERLLHEGSRVVGAAVRDRLTGEAFEIRSRLTVNAAGPWAEGLLQQSGAAGDGAGTYSRDACFVVPRRTAARMALAIPGQTRDSDALLARDARHLFLVPWREHTLVGVWHRVVERDPDGVALTREELRGFIDEINACYPAAQLSESEVSTAGFGLVPFGEPDRQRPGALSFGKQSRLIDHRTQGCAGLITLISVRYTVARRDAAAVLDAAAEQLGARRDGAASARQALPGGEIENFGEFLQDLGARWPQWLPHASREALAQNYGCQLARILKLGEANSALRRCLPGTPVSHAEVAYVVREEMALRMADVLFRRTDLGTAGHPGAAALDELEQLMRTQSGWSAARAEAERAEVERHFERYLAQRPAPPAVPAADRMQA
jgi:glycerol-3-phosphate dehydrogenase